jgi:DNA gyrase/topoisomerase IV subunit B
MIGSVERYTADQIQVVTFEEHVRARPAMYFRVARDSPELPTEILQQVVWDALHHRDGTHGQISVEIGSDLVFSVEDDQRRTADERGTPLPGFFGSLLDKERWAPAAAAVLSVRTVVEVRLDGRGFRQELAGAVATGAWEEFATSKPSGMRTTFHLDPSYCGPDEAIAWSLLPEELHGRECAAHPSPVTFAIHDLREEAEGSAGE